MSCWHRSCGSRAPGYHECCLLKDDSFAGPCLKFPYVDGVVVAKLLLGILPKSQPACLWSSPMLHAFSVTV